MYVDTRVNLDGWRAAAAATGKARLQEEEKEEEEKGKKRCFCYAQKQIGKRGEGKRERGKWREELAGYS